MISYRSCLIYLAAMVLALLVSLAVANGAQAAPKAVITWTDSSTGEEFFEVQKAPTVNGAWSAFAKTGPNVTTVEDTTVTVGQTVCYRVRAGAGTIFTAFSLGKCATAPNTLVVPGGLSVTIVDQ